MTEDQNIVTLEDFVPSGQAIGTLPDGRKVFVWGGLPKETVEVSLTKRKRNYAHGSVERVIEPSLQRVEPRDAAYLSTSPWQIVPWELENESKHRLLQENFTQHDLDVTTTWTAGEQQWHYRNKMEFSFWWDHDTGLELAFHKRGTNTKLAVQGSALASPVINSEALLLKNRLAAQGVEARELKTMIIRSSQDGQTAAVLYVKNKQRRYPKALQGNLKSLTIFFSNPRSPASVPTEKIVEYGDPMMADSLMDRQFFYSATSFFQVNIEVFSLALKKIKTEIATSGRIIDLYSGIGSIGLSVGADALVELDEVSADFAERNAQGAAEVVHAASEKAVEYIAQADTLIVDPPRAGLHPKVVEAILKNTPTQLVYLSCNPATQARDLALLKEVYTIDSIHGYNFFPKTPHIESLAILQCSRE